MINPFVIVIGSSAGGVTALQELIAGIPSGFQVPIFIVQHVAADSKSYLPEILIKISPLPACHPNDGQQIQPGNIYIAPPDHHMLIEKGHIVVKQGPKENRFRPSIDALFRSAAYHFGANVIGVILTGRLGSHLILAVRTVAGLWFKSRRGTLPGSAAILAMVSRLAHSCLK